MAQAIRAPKGGCVGINGEYYFGGEFLPNSNHPKGIWGKVSKSRAKTKSLVGRKRELRPFYWKPITRELVSFFESQLTENEFIKDLTGAWEMAMQYQEGQAETWRACIWAIGPNGKPGFVRNITTDRFNY